MKMRSPEKKIAKFTFEFEYPATMSDEEITRRARHDLEAHLSKEIMNVRPYIMTIPADFVTHCSGCGARLVITMNEKEKEIVCPFMGCGKSQGFRGHIRIAGGRDENE